MWEGKLLLSHIFHLIYSSSEDISFIYIYIYIALYDSCLNVKDLVADLTLSHAKSALGSRRSPARRGGWGGRWGCEMEMISMHFVVYHDLVFILQ